MRSSADFSIPIVLTAEEIAAMLDVQASGTRVDFVVSNGIVWIPIGGLELGIGESSVDAFMRCIWRGRVNKMPIQEFCGHLLGLADIHGLNLSERLICRVHSLASAVPEDDCLAVDALVEILLDLLGAGFTINARVGSKARVLIGRSAKSGRYYGSRRLKRFLTSRRPDDSEA